MGRRCREQLNRLIREPDKDLHTVCIKVEGEEVLPRIRAVGHNRRRVPLRVVVLVLGMVRGSWPYLDCSTWAKNAGNSTGVSCLIFAAWIP